MDPYRIEPPASELLASIIASDPETAHQALIVLCRSDDKICAKAHKQLTKLLTLQTTTRKRKATSEPKHCEQCEDVFEEDANPPGSCVYHPGEMEQDDDSSTWDDWMEHRDPDPDDPETKIELPEGYRWSCCEKRGNEEGCVRSQHEGPAVLKSRDARYYDRPCKPWLL